MTGHGPFIRGRIGNTRSLLAQLQPSLKCKGSKMHFQRFSELIAFHWLTFHNAESSVTLTSAKCCCAAAWIWTLAAVCTHALCWGHVSCNGPHKRSKSGRLYTLTINIVESVETLYQMYDCLISNRITECRKEETIQGALLGKTIF